MWLKYLSKITEGELEGTRSRGVFNVWLKMWFLYDRESQMRDLIRITV